jgi:hypothetical protein
LINVRLVFREPQSGRQRDIVFRCSALGGRAKAEAAPGAGRRAENPREVGLIGKAAIERDLT